MSKDYMIFIRHIIECIDTIQGYIAHKTYEDFSRGIQIQDAVIRRIEIIGEAAKNIPQEIKDKHPISPCL